ncbi:aminotransferase class I/II-fold pyridoxal phosphate-dependent enzyme [Kitasatospora sp. CM 4170]|uniref:8-amino-7-oxononanoate synthase n=1 Tax=Kitasatospora aburaviensis TaxID=67265 RepID=A0ABW1ERD4_9ACTN|nr:aminotransferase class I/II-fold pyridoxal phosphate-dependent enzyme [Kitasatospora sp. CM 4170]WNM48540.1 aminotransferase class I/II-fold pyridoxal phosphate-dependent enzyme [Kitasatospora sp. CM 4170]
MTEATEPAESVQGPRRYRNAAAMLATADPVWQAAGANGLIGIKVDSESNNRLIVRETGHEFANMVSCAYLGLNNHPQVAAGAVDALTESRSTWLVTSTTRIRHNLLVRLEEELGDLFGAHVLPGASCTSLTAGILPLVASGHLNDRCDGSSDGPRVMVFDRFCHFCMAYVKPICADEALVLNCPHNDLDYLEDICRKYPRVAYVADGAYSMGGAAALDGLLELQDRYGLFLYIDDSHSLSIMGERGEGFVRSRLEMNPLTVIVASLGKGFGTGGGIAMLGNREQFEFLHRHAGPVGWSQNVALPLVGASLGSAAIHRSPELAELQGRLNRNIDLFDELLPTSFAGNGLPVRRVDVGDAERAVKLSAQLFERGFYSSAVFFPIVPKGEAGLRLMMRADMDERLITEFAGHVKELTADL